MLWHKQPIIRTMTSTGDKVTQIFKRYDDDNALIAELESRVRQKDSEIKVIAGELTKKKEVIDHLKLHLAAGMQEGTSLLENKKHLKAAICAVMQQKKERYLKTVAAENAIRIVDEQKRSNYRDHIAYLEGKVDEKIRICESFAARLMEARAALPEGVAERYAAAAPMRMLRLVGDVEGEGDQTGSEEEVVAMNE